MVSSTESAIRSRDTSEDFTPDGPIAIPSVTVMVVNSRGVPPVSRHAFLHRLRLPADAMLHGAASFQQVANADEGAGRFPPR